MKNEIERLATMYQYETAAFEKGYCCIAGIDEAGRGPLAGPVVAAACILQKGDLIEGVNDSKKLSEKKREKLYQIIVESAISFGIGMVDPVLIDEINILNATKKAMLDAVDNLNVKPDILFIDAVKLNACNIEQIPIIKGDTLSLSIAAASILAKVTRDRIMVEYAKKYPEYGFERHKGYGTKDHYEAIEKFGLTEIHRKSFTKGYW